jgi:riboflavin kinase/FMN adenylyltransferase
VYSVLVRIDENKLRGVANIGAQPTFERVTHSIEAHIIDFQQDLYGRKVTIEFVDKIREVKKFQSVQDLTDQIKKDVKAAEKSFTKISFT